MAGAQALGHLAGGQVAGEGVLEHCHLAVEHGHVDALADAAAFPLVERCQNADGGEEGAAEVGRGEAGPHRPAAGLAGDAHGARHRLHDDVEGRPVDVRPRLAEPRARRVNEAGVRFLQIFVAEAEAFHRPGDEVLDQHVHLAGEGAGDLSAALVL